MSMHTSFKGDGGLATHRNVLTRKERIERLKEENRYEEGGSVTGLPKVRNIKLN